MNGRDDPSVTSGNWELLHILLGKKQRTYADCELAHHEKSKRRKMYNNINQNLNETDAGEFSYFLNYGYVDTEVAGHSVIDLPPKYFDRNSHRLVLEVIGNCPLQGMDVLDVGCGRGGVASVLEKFFNPNSYLGIDLSSEAIDFCREAHDHDWMRFEEGDAEQMPIPDGSVDVVINIESSHCYPNLKGFYAEVARVLKRGGWFLYTDIMPAEIFDSCQQMMLDLGFVIHRNENISANVMGACKDQAARRLRAYSDPNEREYMANFLGAPGSELFEALEKGALSYRLYQVTLT